jgi:hypothetical protein
MLIRSVRVSLLVCLAAAGVLGAPSPAPAQPLTRFERVETYDEMRLRHHQRRELHRAWVNASSEAERTEALRAILDGQAAGAEAAIMLLGETDPRRFPERHEILRQAVQALGPWGMAFLFENLEDGTPIKPLAYAEAYLALSDEQRAIYLDAARRLDPLDTSAIIGLMGDSPVVTRPEIREFVVDRYEQDHTGDLSQRILIFIDKNSGAADFLPSAMRNAERGDSFAFRIVRERGGRNSPVDVWPFTMLAHTMLEVGSAYVRETAFVELVQSLPWTTARTVGLELIELAGPSPSHYRHRITWHLARTAPDDASRLQFFIDLEPQTDVSTALFQRGLTAEGLTDARAEAMFRHFAFLWRTPQSQWQSGGGGTGILRAWIDPESGARLIRRAIADGTPEDALAALVIASDRPPRLTEDDRRALRPVITRWVYGPSSPFDRGRRDILKAIGASDRDVLLALLEARLTKPTDFRNARTDEILGLCVEGLGAQRDPFEYEVDLLGSLFERGVLAQEAANIIAAGGRAYARAIEPVESVALTTRDEERRALAFRVLARLSAGDPERTVRLLELSGNSDPQIRAMARRAFLSLWGVGRERGGPLEVAALAHPDLLLNAITSQPEVRWRVLTPKPLVEQINGLLIARALEHPGDLEHPAWKEVQSFRLWDPALAKPLLTQIEFGDAEQAQEAIHILMRSAPGERATFDGLMAALRGSHPSARILALRALVERREWWDEAAEAVRPLLRDPDERVAKEAASALDRMGMRRGGVVN